MAIPFIGQILMFGGNFEPRTWAFCNGQLLPISQNTALFSILGTTFGGDGVSTFGLPDLRGRVPIGARQGGGLTNRFLGEIGGSEQNLISPAQMPSHHHSVQIPVSDEDPSKDEANGSVLANGQRYTGAGSTNQKYGQNLATGNKGTGQPVNDMMPYLVVNYIIALQGTYPSRN
ncbi:MAG: phage tail protein [Saprospiraceae bacterium]|nr:phage tail protein [Saprospiraceae bacterium]